MATDEGEASEDRVPPLEHRAWFDIGAEDGYVRIDQSWGDKPLYTPEEARDIAEEILAVVDAAEGD